MTRISRYLDVGYEDRMLGAVLGEPASVRRWLVARDDRLDPGAPLAIIDTPAAELLIRIRFRCVVDSLVAEVGERLYRGMVLLRVGASPQDKPEERRYCDSERTPKPSAPAT